LSDTCRYVVLRYNGITFFNANIDTHLDICPYVVTNTLLAKLPVNNIWNYFKTITCSVSKKIQYKYSTILQKINTLIILVSTPFSIILVIKIHSTLELQNLLQNLPRNEGKYISNNLQKLYISIRYVHLK
jgi:pantothenate kinase-related protein Tda10